MLTSIASEDVALFSVMVNVRWFPRDVDDIMVMMIEVGCVHELERATS